MYLKERWELKGGIGTSLFRIKEQHLKRESEVNDLSEELKGSHHGWTQIPKTFRQPRDKGGRWGPTYNQGTLDILNCILRAMKIE